MRLVPCEFACSSEQASSPLLGRVEFPCWKRHVTECRCLGSKKECGHADGRTHNPDASAQDIRPRTSESCACLFLGDSPGVPQLQNLARIRWLLHVLVTRSSLIERSAQDQFERLSRSGRRRRIDRDDASYLGRRQLPCEMSLSLVLLVSVSYS